jgi:hypothetical protein
MKNVKNVLLVLVVLSALSLSVSKYYAINLDSSCFLFKSISNWILHFGILPLITFILIKDKK